MPASPIYVRRGSKLTTIKRAMIFIRQDAGVPWKVSKATIRSLVKFITAELLAGRVPEFDGLGKFTIQHRKGWTGLRKLGGREERIVTSPDAYRVQFKPARRLRLAVKPGPQPAP